MTDQISRDEIGVDTIVQIDPDHDPVFGAALLVVTELKAWGVQGYAKVPGGGAAFYRAPWSAIRSTGGKAIWVRTVDVNPADGEDA